MNDSPDGIPIEAAKKVFPVLELCMQLLRFTIKFCSIYYCNANMRLGVRERMVKRRAQRRVRAETVCTGYL